MIFHFARVWRLCSIDQCKFYAQPYLERTGFPQFPDAMRTKFQDSVNCTSSYWLCQVEPGHHDLAYLDETGNLKCSITEICAFFGSFKAELR